MHSIIICLIQIGTNPGGLNVENEYPVANGLSANWAVISGMSAAPKWSSIVTLPFTFQFNGVGYTQFKVSTSGVLTFSTGATAVPPEQMRYRLTPHFDQRLYKY